MTIAAPAPPPAARRFTPEDLLQMADEGKDYELVDGQLVPRDAGPKEQVMSAEPSRVGLCVGHHVWAFTATRHPAWAFGADAGFRCFPDDPNRVRRADIAVIAFDRMTPEQYRTRGFIPTCPDLVVEVLSPNDLAEDVTRKRREWLAAGVRLVWIVDPADESVTAYPAGGRPVIFQTADTLPGDPVLPGFAVPVADLFRLPVPPA